MNQCRKSLSRAFVTHHQAAEGLQPRVGPLDDPAALVSSELTPILMRRHSVVATCRNDRLNGTLDQQGSHRIAVIATVCNQPLGLAALSAATSDAPVYERLFEEFDLRGGKPSPRVFRAEYPCHRPVP